MWFEGRSENKILAWRNYRSQLVNWPQDIENVAKAWSRAPLVSYNIDFHNINSWPPIWEIIGQGIYCSFSVSLGMLYTLYFSTYPDKNNLELRGFRLKQDHVDLNLLFCEQGKYVLNYNIGSVVNSSAVPTSAELIYSYKLQNILN